MKKILNFLLLLGLVSGGVAGGVWWWFNRVDMVDGPEGFQVPVPHGWDRDKGKELAFQGKLADGKDGQAWARFRSHGNVAWPDAAIDEFEGTPEEYKTTELDQLRAVVGVVNRRGLGWYIAVVDRGDGFIVWRIGCATEDFDKNRAAFERLAGRIKCEKPSSP